MENKQGKLTTIVLGVLLVLAIGYAFYSNTIHNELVEELEIEKAEIIEELDQLEIQYDAKIEEGTVLKAKLVAAREDIVSYRDSLTTQKKTSYSTIKRYKNRVYSLQAKNKELFAQVEQLTVDNSKLNEEIVEAKATIETKDAENAELTAENEELSAKVAVASELEVDKLTAVSMKKKSSGALSETSKAKYTDAFRLSFKIGQNVLTPGGDKIAYIIIADPMGKVVSAKGKIEDGENEIYYSDTTTIDYQNTDTDVIVITDVNREENQKGVYTISAILDGKSIGETTIILK